MRLRRREFVKAAAVAAGATTTTGTATTASRDYPAAQPDRGEPRAYADYSVRRVPEDYDAIQSAVDDAEERDLVLVGEGVYREAVEVETPRVTVRGRDRNGVVLDGEFERNNGVIATADGVVVENMTARHHEHNGFFWKGVDGYRGSYLTAYNNRLYGVYAFDSVNGRFDDSYASGHGDSGFYIGQSNPSRAVIADVVAENNAVGYSGTNAGGYLTVKDSVWRNNMAGIVPNSLDSEDLAPQEAARIEGNEVYDNNNEGAPDVEFGHMAFGTGILVAGGVDNEVYDNEVRDHLNFGVAAVPNVDENLYVPEGNHVRGNHVEASGRADIALGTPSGGGNVFEENDHSKSRPGGLEGGLLSGFGDPWVTLVMVKQFLQRGMGSTSHGKSRNMPEPDDQPPMPDASIPPREPVGRSDDG